MNKKSEIGNYDWMQDLEADYQQIIALSDRVLKIATDAGERSRKSPHVEYTKEFFQIVEGLLLLRSVMGIK